MQYSLKTESGSQLTLNNATQKQEIQEAVFHVDSIKYILTFLPILEEKILKMSGTILIQCFVTQ